MLNIDLSFVIELKTLWDQCSTVNMHVVQGDLSFDVIKCSCYYINPYNLIY